MLMKSNSEIKKNEKKARIKYAYEKISCFFNVIK